MGSAVAIGVTDAATSRMSTTTKTPTTVACSLRNSLTNAWTAVPDETASLTSSTRRFLTAAPRTLGSWSSWPTYPVSYTHLRAHETDSYLVCRLLLEKKQQT